MVVIVVSEEFIPWDDPRLRVVGGLLPVWYVTSPIAVDIYSKRWMNYYDPF